MGKETPLEETRLWPALIAIFGFVFGAMCSLPAGTITSINWVTGIGFATFYAGGFGIMTWGEEKIDLNYRIFLGGMFVGLGLTAYLLSHVVAYSAVVALAFLATLSLFIWMGRKPLERHELFVATFFTLFLGLAIGFARSWGAWSLLGYAAVPAALYFYRK